MRKIIYALLLCFASIGYAQAQYPKVVKFSIDIKASTTYDNQLNYVDIHSGASDSIKFNVQIVTTPVGTNNKPSPFTLKAYLAIFVPGQSSPTKLSTVLTFTEKDYNTDPSKASAFITKSGKQAIPGLAQYNGAAIALMFDDGHPKGTNEDDYVEQSPPYVLNVMSGSAPIVNTGDNAPEGTAFIYRMFSSNGKHFYTTNILEVSAMLDANTYAKPITSFWWSLYAAVFGGNGTSVNWSTEGNMGRVCTSQVSGTVPLYRYFNSKNGDHMYSISSSEGQTLISLGYTQEGIVGYVYPTQVTGTIPMYRYNNNTFGHFFTILYVELQDGKDGYTREGTTFYVLPNDANNPPPTQISLTYPHNGDIILDVITGRVCMMFENQLRTFPNPDIYNNLVTADASTYKRYNTETITSWNVNGPPFSRNSSLISDANTGKVYLREDNLIRWYPNVPVATTYHMNWNAIQTVYDISNYVVGATISN